MAAVGLESSIDKSIVSNIIFSSSIALLLFSLFLLLRWIFKAIYTPNVTLHASKHHPPLPAASANGAPFDAWASQCS